MEPVRREEIPEGFKLHDTHLFMIKKFTADGHHDKYKSWLVVHGYEQDYKNYADQSLPMVAIQSLMTCLTLAACNIDGVVGKLDVKGDFIQMEMSGIPIYVQCRGKLKDLILKELPELKGYIGSDGVLNYRLRKA